MTASGASEVVMHATAIWARAWPSAITKADGSTADFEVTFDRM